MKYVDFVICCMVLFIYVCFCLVLLVVLCGMWCGGVLVLFGVVVMMWMLCFVYFIVSVDVSVLMLFFVVEYGMC